MEKTVVKALRLLEALSRSAEPRGVTDIAAELGLTKANAHRLLRTLLAEGHVRQYPDATYGLTLKMWRLGARRVESFEVLDAARPVVRELARASGESVQLGVPEGTAVVCIDKADGTRLLRGTTILPARVPAHAMASGKALLAYDDDMSSQLQFPLKQYTASTICDEQWLRDELQQIRNSGISISRGEWLEDVWGIAAPVFGATGKPIAAICLWGAKARLSSSVSEEFVAQVKLAARKISASERDDAHL